MDKLVQSGGYFYCIFLSEVDDLEYTSPIGVAVCNNKIMKMTGQAH
jgi:hypothetical protein